MPPTTQLPPRSEPLSPDDKAPDFTLLDQDKQEWTLSKALEKGPVVLCFFPMAFTGVCTTEMECITREFDRWAGKGMEVVGVSCDSFATLKAWADHGGFRHRLLADMHRAVCRGYGLYWPDLNIARRGTVIVERGADGSPVVAWSQSREAGNAMDFEEILKAVAS